MIWLEGKEYLILGRPRMEFADLIWLFHVVDWVLVQVVYVYSRAAKDQIFLTL
jgi:hypothetical protein